MSPGYMQLKLFREESLMNKNRLLRAILVIASAGFIVAGCAMPAPTIQTGPDAEVTFDGLNKVDNPKADLAWARPDFDISRYTKILPVQAQYEYRQDVNRARTTIERGRGGPYYIDAERRAQFEAEVRRVFEEELLKIEHFEFVTEPGPDVLMLRGALLDIVTFVPDEDNIAGRSETFVSSVGEATLVLELRDSESGTILARSIDRRAAERMGGQMMNSNSVTNAQEVRRLMRFWATRLRDGLDGFVEQANAPAN